MAAAGHNRRQPEQVLQRKEKQMEKKEMILEREFISIYEMNVIPHAVSVPTKSSGVSAACGA